MERRLYPVTERPLENTSEGHAVGKALARVVEAHSALVDLMDFCPADPVQIALEVGMVSPLEDGDLDDLREIDLGEPEWYEASAGLPMVRQALSALRRAPESVRAAIYDPGLEPEDVIADLEAIEQTLLAAQQQETRFHFRMEDTKSPIRQP
jgi:hypothetical protein